MDDKQYEFNLKELAEFLEQRKDIAELSLHSSGSGAVKVNRITEVTITSSAKETLEHLKSGRLAVGTYGLAEDGSLIHYRKKWVSPTSV